MNTVTTSSTVNPGYGYRLLKDGEMVVDTDEYFTRSLWHSRKNMGAGSTFLSSWYPTRRKIDVGSGYRLVGENETVLASDQWENPGDFSEWSSGTSGGSVGLTPARAISTGHAPEATIWRRKVEAPKPAPRTPPGTPPTGYRFLVEGEIIQAGDSWVSPTFERLVPATEDFNNYVGSRVGARRCDLAHCPFVRPVKPTREVELESRIATLESTLLNLHADNSGLQSHLKTTESALASVRDHNGQMLRYNYELETKLESMRKNASGNAVLVRADGFSRPVELPTGFALRSVLLPVRTERACYSGWDTQTFDRTGTTDGFGRAVFKQAA